SSRSAACPVAQETEARLKSLRAGHPFRAFLEGHIQTRGRVRPAIELLARAFVLDVMVADLQSGHASSPYLKNDCHALVRGALWTAQWAADQLQPTLFFGEAHLQRYALLGTGRSSHRSRVALLSSLRQFRGAYPKLFPSSRSEAEPPPMEAVNDDEFDYALERAETFRSDSTRRFVKGWLLLSRAAGLDGADMRYVAGTDVVKRRRAGVWVIVRRPGHEREVPVIEDWAEPLIELAEMAGAFSMISRSMPPATVNRSNELTSMLARHLGTTYPSLKVTPDRTRSAWLAEQLRRDVPLRTLLQAAGLKSLRSIERLVAELPPPARSVRQVAFELGGVSELYDGRLSATSGGMA
ncbi:MAG: hypothetical protein WA809_08220, partial [Candidatus Dormiibacterota bacterium]